ncbi:sigma-54 dependent transcriptional regulator [bacterium]|nr:sigma-54 dependent transcriptional regulator [bacterium]
MAIKPSVLVVDDEETIRKLLKSRLTREELEVKVAGNAEEAQAAFKQDPTIGVIVTDLRMPGKDGFALMEWAKSQSKHVRVIVITGHGEKEVAIKALKQGAADYLEKPFDLEELTHAVKRCLHECELERQNADLVDRLEARVERVEGKSEDQFWFVSKASSMNKVNEWLQVLRREAMRGEAEEPTALILGESGTGKEGIARMIHAGSRRGRGPWVAVNCANFNEQLLESELFGHEKGSFTGANSMKRGLFEIARGGTLFLDEVGEMDVKLQAKLLRVLQEKMYRRVGGTQDMDADVRVVAATNNDLQEKMKSGKFREDLYHRLSRVVVEVPSLRSRGNDVVEMAKQFCERAFKNRGKTFSGFSPEATDALSSYDWPGNVRELLNVVERVAIIHEGNLPIAARELSISASSGGTKANGSTTHTSGNGAGLKLVGSAPAVDTEGAGYMVLKKKWCDAFEREYLTSLLTRHSGNVSASAREAKIDRSNFLRLLRRHGIRRHEEQKAA